MRVLKKKGLLAALLLVPGVLLGGCSSVQVINALVPENDFKLVADQSYGSSARQKLDIYTPLQKTAGQWPVVVFFYGGNWDSGAKKDYLFVAEALASRGFLTVVADYRLYPEVRYPGFLEDGAAAVAWTLDHLSDYNGDPAQVHLMGHSAGAYIAATLVLDKRWLGPRVAAIKSVVGLAGPYDFLPLTDPTLKTIFGTESDLTRTQPITYADGKAPPMLLISGLKDVTVYPKNSINLAQRIRQNGGQAYEHYYPKLNHYTLVGSMAKPLRFLAPVLDDVSAYMKDGAVPKDAAD